MTITLFGSTGDLSKRKLFPALYNMYALNQLSDDFKIISIGRKAYTHSQFIEVIEPWVKEYTRLSFKHEIFEKFKSKILYYQMELTDVESYRKLDEFYKEHNIKQQAFYLALSPIHFHPVLEILGKLTHIQESSCIIEKPFGIDTQDKIEINYKLNKTFKKKNIFYIDHYLGKEMVQNIKTIRFKNAMFKHTWNNKMIKSIQISALESIGIEDRGNYYDKSGALHDMVVNHLFQILTILTMDESEHQHDAQYEILKNLTVIQTLFGQYEGYLNEKDVDPNSSTETYVELECRVNHEKWKGVPIYIRTGKKLQKREMNIIVEFHPIDDNPSNILEIKIQPNEGVYLQFNIKKPGYEDTIETVKMEFCQSCIEVNQLNTPDAYERLFNEILHHKQEYFASFEEILESSKIIESIEKQKPFIYKDSIPQSLTNWRENKS